MIEKVDVPAEVGVDFSQVEAFLYANVEILPQWAHKLTYPPVDPVAYELALQLQGLTRDLRTVEVETSEGVKKQQVLPAAPDFTEYVSHKISDTEGSEVNKTKLAEKMLTATSEADLQGLRFTYSEFIPVTSLEAALTRALVLCQKIAAQAKQFTQTHGFLSDSLPPVEPTPEQFSVLQQLASYELFLRNLQEQVRVFTLYLFVTQAHTRMDDPQAAAYVNELLHQSEKMSERLASELKREDFLEMLYLYLSEIGVEELEKHPVLKQMYQNVIGAFPEGRGKELDLELAFVEAAAKHEKLENRRIRNAKFFDAFTKLGNTDPESVKQKWTEVESYRIQRGLGRDSAQKLSKVLLDQVFVEADLAGSEQAMTLLAHRSLGEINENSTVILGKLKDESQREELRKMLLFAQEAGLLELRFSELNSVISMEEDVLETGHTLTPNEHFLTKEMTSFQFVRFAQQLLRNRGLDSVIVTQYDPAETRFQFVIEKRNAFAASAAENCIYVPAPNILSYERACGLFSHEIFTHVMSTQRIKDTMPLLSNTPGSTDANEAVATSLEVVTSYMLDNPSIPQIDVRDVSQFDDLYRAKRRERLAELKSYSEALAAFGDVPITTGVGTFSLHVLAFGLFLNMDQPHYQEGAIRRSPLEMFKVMQQILEVRGQLKQTSNARTKAAESVVSSGILRVLRGVNRDLDVKSPHILLKDIVYFLGNEIKRAALLNQDGAKLAGLSVGRVSPEFVQYVNILASELHGQEELCVLKRQELFDALDAIAAEK